MPKPKIDAVYQVWGNRLNTSLANASEKIPVRVLGGTRWIIPKSGTSPQPHLAISARRFRVTDHDRSMSFPEGLLVCWVQEPGRPGDTGLRAATGPDAVQQLRALDRPDLARYRDFLYGAAKVNNLQLDVVNAPDLTELVPEETPVATTPSTFTPRANTHGNFYLVAPVAVENAELIADLDEGKVSSSMAAGLRAGEVFAVWDFAERPNPTQAVEFARDRRPARVLVHVGDGELLQLHENYRFVLECKES